MAGDSENNPSREEPNSVRDIFKSPCYGPVMESYETAHAWIRSHSRRFAGFVNGEFVASTLGGTYPVRNLETSAALASVAVATATDVSAAVKAARAAQATWATAPVFERSNYLYSLARGVQKQSTLLALLESLQSGKTLNEARTKDMAYNVQSLYHCAGWAMHLAESFPNCKPQGVVGVAVGDSSSVSAMAAWRVAEILATGNAVVLLVHPQYFLSALLFAEVAASAGLPRGLFNVLVAPQSITAQLLCDARPDAVFFVGQAQLGLEARQLLAGCKTSFSSYHAGRLVAVVLDGADLHSAACGICEAFAGNYGKGEAEGVHVFVQESIHSTFLKLLTKQFSQLRAGLPNDKTTDLSCFSLPGRELQTEPIVSKMPGAVTVDISNFETKSSPTPVLLPDVAPSSNTVDTVGLPLLLVTQFRTPKEALSLVNCVRSRVSVSLWTEKLACALELAAGLKVASVFVNSPPLCDPAAEFGGVKTSGLGRIGGQEGLLTFLKPAWSTQTPIEKPKFDFNSYGNETRPNSVLPGGIVSPTTKTPGVDKTFKLFYAGQQKRPESNTSYPVYDSKNCVVGYAPEAGKKDVRNAVEAASAGFNSWSTRTAHNRAQVLYFVAENLSQRAKEFATCISGLESKPLEECEKLVMTCIRRLFYWAGAFDKQVGSVQGPTFKGSVLSIKEPLGVIGVVCSDSEPLLSFVSLVAAAIAAGNSVVALASEKFPLSALEMCEVFATSDVPAGVVNVLSGYQDPMVRTLAEHHDVASVWYHGDSDLAAAFVEYAAAHNGKTTWIRDESRDWNIDDHCTGRLFATHATATKTVWLPSGEVFAN